MATMVAQPPSSFSTRAVIAMKSSRTRSQNHKVPRANSVPRKVNMTKGLLLTLPYTTARGAIFLQPRKNKYRTHDDSGHDRRDDPALAPQPPAFLVAGVRDRAVVHAIGMPERPPRPHESRPRSLCPS